MGDEEAAEEVVEADVVVVVGVDEAEEDVVEVGVVEDAECCALHSRRIIVAVVCGGDVA